MLWIALGCGGIIVLAAIVAAGVFFLPQLLPSLQPALPSGDDATTFVDVTDTMTPAPSETPTITPTPAPVTVRVAPDGSGDYASLEEAVEMLPPGSTIELDAGEYTLSAGLVISKSLYLRGAGMEETSVIGEGEEYVVSFVGPGFFSAEDIHFHYQGDSWARAVQVDDAEIEFSRCKFSGAVWDDDLEKGGDGLLMWGNTIGIVRDCVMEANGLHGIELQDEAQPILQGNICRENTQSGITYFENSGGVARENQVYENGLHGISANEDAQPLIEKNVCTDNAQVGIRLSGSSQAEVRQNECHRNGLHGIVVRGQAQAVLEENVCVENEQSGIVYFDSGGGEARGNECTDNGLHGIGIEEQALPLLENNVCRGNTESGIVYFGETGGTARGNECTDNGLHGISANDQAAPIVEDNVCSGNENAGIRFSDNSSGVVRYNNCSENMLSGIIVREQAQPTLEENVCMDNTEAGIAYFHEAGGLAMRNECAGNKWGLYVEETADPELVENNVYDNTSYDMRDLRPDAGVSPTREVGSAPTATRRPAATLTPTPTETPTPAVSAGPLDFTVPDEVSGWEPVEGGHKATLIINITGGAPPFTVHHDLQQWTTSERNFPVVFTEARCVLVHTITVESADGQSASHNYWITAPGCD